MSSLRASSTQVNWPTVRLHGQASYLLESSTVELAITSLGGMLGPVKFFPGKDRSIRPYHIAPWAEEAVPDDTPAMLQALRGDWFCSAFGENAEPYHGQRLPPHGETANRQWNPIARGQSIAGTWMCLGLDLSVQGGSCEGTTALVKGHSLIYQRHDLSGLTGPINPGHHATLQFPDAEGAGRLSCSALIHAQSYVDFIDGPTSRSYSYLQPHTAISDLRAAPLVSGVTADLTRFPARRGFDDVVILCADPSLAFAWTAVTFPEQGYVWFALRDPKLLASTLLWFSNGGRPFEPWNGRHVNVMGIEDVTSFFHVGIAASCRRNALTDRGIRTCLTAGPGARLSIPYIQGVARIPAGFDQVASIEPGTGCIRLHAESGIRAAVPCHLEFLQSGKLPGLELP